MHLKTQRTFHELRVNDIAILNTYSIVAHDQGCTLFVSNLERIKGHFDVPEIPMKQVVVSPNKDAVYILSITGIVYVFDASGQKQKEISVPMMGVKRIGVSNDGLVMLDGRHVFYFDLNTESTEPTVFERVPALDVGFTMGTFVLMCASKIFLLKESDMEVVEAFELDCDLQKLCVLHSEEKMFVSNENNLKLFSFTGVQDEFTIPFKISNLDINDTDSRLYVYGEMSEGKLNIAFLEEMDGKYQLSQ
ncbi:hypothetical protein PCE1_001621 [Barthelona sp. PCE]